MVVELDVAKGFPTSDAMKSAITKQEDVINSRQIKRRTRVVLSDKQVCMISMRWLRLPFMYPLFNIYPRLREMKERLVLDPVGGEVGCC